MSIYNSQGEEIFGCYDSDGESLASAYAGDGDPIFPETGRVKVMTYNVGKFYNINSQTAMQTAIVNKYRPDVIGLQELSKYTLGTMPKPGQAMLKGYSVKRLSNHNNKVMTATKRFPLHNLVIADYEAQDPLDASEYNETRAYMKADILLGGKTVTFINTHLCYLTQSVKWQQMQELFQIAEQCEYCIITGDFNGNATSASSDDYVQMYKMFVDAGYNLANNSPDAGFIKTYSNATTAATIDDLQTALDSIIVSGNIDIVDVVFDATKLDYLNGKSIDHIPVVAELQIN